MKRRNPIVKCALTGLTLGLLALLVIFGFVCTGCSGDKVEMTFEQEKRIQAICDSQIVSHTFNINETHVCGNTGHGRALYCYPLNSYIRDEIAYALREQSFSDILYWTTDTVGYTFDYNTCTQSPQLEIVYKKKLFVALTPNQYCKLMELLNENK